ncbi:MAG: DUF4262 domain-containing protein [Pseudomonadota bacterium]
MTDKMSDAIERNIAEHGWHCQSVHGDADFPPFAYSIGWGMTRTWPEFLIVGAARPSLSTSMIWRVWESGRRPCPGEVRDDILDGYDCPMRAVDLSWFPFLFGRAIDAYMTRGLKPFEAVQCIWPTTAHVLPWEPEASEQFVKRQPILDRPMQREPGT